MGAGQYLYMQISSNEFGYGTSFSRNLGILSKDEQSRLKNSSIAIVGIGGAGGTMAIILARSGIANFILIDPDKYELSNSNRHIGSYCDTLGRYKSEVIKEEIHRINPEANVEARTRKLSFGEMKDVIDNSDVIIPAADDVAYSSKIITMAQEKKKCAISFMPSGLTGYVMVFPPSLSSIIEPADIFGAPKGLSYKELHKFLEDPLHKCGRRWYINRGKWRIGWFQKWRQDEVPLAQICPNVWLGASLASIEVIKYLTGKWKTIKAPKMWHLQSAENQIKVGRFRKRTWFFSKYIVWAFSIKWLGIGLNIRSFASKQNQKQLERIRKQENEGKEIKYPFLWRHII